MKVNVTVDPENGIDVGCYVGALARMYLHLVVHLHDEGAVDGRRLAASLRLDDISGGLAHKFKEDVAALIVESIDQLAVQGPRQLKVVDNG